MNILVFTESSWNDKDSIGNTLNNWFTNWNDNFSHFFIRKQVPNNEISKHYYNISSKDIIKGIIKFKIKGLEFSHDDLPKVLDVFSIENEKEQKLINSIHAKAKGSKILYWLNDVLWMSKIWFNKYTKDFLNRAKPDVIFALTKSSIILKPIYLYCNKKFNTKLVLFAADDVFGQYLKYGFFRRKYNCKYFEWAIKRADLLYCASDMMSRYYKQIFDVDTKTLTKGCDYNLKAVCKEKNKKNLNLVYAGNLFYLRDEVLLLIAKTIYDNNLPIMLDIYTSSTDNDQIQKFDIYRSVTNIYRLCPYTKVMEAMNKSDYVLVVESFEKKIIDEVKYSYSTKVIDAIQAASGVLAVGPLEDNTIYTLANIDGVYSITNPSELLLKLNELLENEEDRTISIKKIKKYAEDHLDITKIRCGLFDDFNSIYTNSDNRVE